MHLRVRAEGPHDYKGDTCGRRWGVRAGHGEPRRNSESKVMGSWDFQDDERRPHLPLSQPNN